MPSSTLLSLRRWLLRTTSPPSLFISRNEYSTITSSYFVTSNNKNTSNNSRRNNKNQNAIIHHHRTKTTTIVCPSSAQTAFAFAQITPKGQESISRDEFLRIIPQMKLDYGLSRVELERIFAKLDLNGDGRLSYDEFRSSSIPFTTALVEVLSNNKRGEDDDESDRCKIQPKYLFPPKTFDAEKSTAEFYAAPLSKGFVGDYISIRSGMDYDYHRNYMHLRQHFQDELIRECVLLKGGYGGGGASAVSNRSPWLVHTCGPMGAGKGWVLGWMSQQGYIPLEEVSKIDPDFFKLQLPEWQSYQRVNPKMAGTLTHEESSYLAELAQIVAMDNGMDVWVDGSMRDHGWYEKHFKAVRKRWPEYRIAILMIDATEEVIEERLEMRGKKTGRWVPEDLKKKSLVSVEKALWKLSPQVDLIAFIGNEGTGKEPVLRAVSTVDRSGNWELIKVLTSD